MRKQALIAALMAGVSASSFSEAKGLDFKVSGVLKTYAAITSAKIRSTKAAQFGTYGNISFNAGSVAANGINYGAIGVLQLDRNKGNEDRISEAYLYFGSDTFGNVQFGDTHGVESLMMYDGTDVMGGTGGFDGNLDKILNITRGVNFGQDIGTCNNGFNRATKVTYITPEFSGFQVGVSYTPNSDQHGRSYNTRALNEKGDMQTKKVPFAQNQISGGLSYTKEFGAYTVGLYAVGVTGKAVVPAGTTAQANGIALHSVRTWRVGTLIDYKNWQFGAGYFNNGKSFMRKDTNFTNTKGYNVAVGYGVGPASLALGYTSTSRKVTGGKAKASIASFTVDYHVAEGIAAYVEADYFDMKAPKEHIDGTNFNPETDFLDRMPSSNGENRGSAFILGTRVNF